MTVKSIQSRIIAAILTSGVAVTLIFSAVLYPLEKNRRAHRLGDVHSLLSTVYEQKREDLANEIFSAKMQALERTIQDVLGVQGVVSVCVFNNLGDALVATHPPASPLTPDQLAELDDHTLFIQEKHAGEDVATFVTPIEIIGERVGFIKIHYSLRDILQETRLNIVFFASLMVFLVLLMSVLLHILLARSVTAPIARLREAIGRFQKGDYQARVDNPSQDQIGEVATAFNEMSQALFKALLDKDAYAAKLEDSYRDLRVKAGELEEANQRLRELDSMKSHFLSLVSHELRTPLTSVLGFAKLIAKDFHILSRQLPEDNGANSKTERIASNLNIIIKESERLTDMINDVLDLSRIESGNMQWRMETVEPQQLIRQAAQAVRGLLSQKPKVRLIVDNAPDLPGFPADPGRMHQVILNLLSNAIKFSDSGEILLYADFGPNQSIRFSVQDHGPGILPKDLRTIFDKFHQASTAGDQTKPQGSGLGLAISKHIVDQHKGRIWAESHPGNGATFFVELPLK